MSADSVHHGVEEAMRKLPGGNVYDFNDFCEVVQGSNGGRIDVQVMKNCDFRNFSAQTSAAMLKRRDRPLLSDITEVQFRRESRVLWYKKDRLDVYQEFDFLKKKFAMAMPSDLLRPKGPRGVTSSKKKDIIQKLCPMMPDSRCLFWKKLPVNDSSSDLIGNFE
jgi:hypothetical protein